MTKLERLKERYSSNGEEIVCAIRIRQLIEEIERLKAALEEVASSNGGHALVNSDTEIARKALAEHHERWG